MQGPLLSCQRHPSPDSQFGTLFYIFYALEPCQKSLPCRLYLMGKVEGKKAPRKSKRRTGDTYT